MRAIFILMLIKIALQEDRFVKKYTANILDVKILYV